MKNFLKMLILILVIFILLVSIANVIYNNNIDNFVYSYDCCDYSTGNMWEYPCKCDTDKNIFEKTLIVLNII